MTISDMGSARGPDRDRLYHRGPAPGWVAVVFTALFAAGLITPALMTHGAPYPTPSTPATAAQEYYARYADAVQVAAFFQFSAAIPLGIWTATITSRLRFHSITVAGVSIALFGGLAASLLLALSGLIEWVLSQPGMATDITAVRWLQLLAFATGGVGHIAPLGLLLAGVSVTAGFHRLLPRWQIVLGLVLAVFGEFSTLSLILPAASYLLPLCRFPAFVWLISAGFSLPDSKGSDR